MKKSTKDELEFQDPDDSEVSLTKKLALARKQKEEAEAAAALAASEAEAQATAAEPLPEPVTDAPLEEKELLYAGLEKMGCSRNYLIKMKERHGTIIIYPHEDTSWYVIRPLKVKEMRLIREIAAGDGEKLNKEILETAVVFPKLVDDSVSELPAGLPDLLVNMISRLSAFIPVELAFSLSKEL